MPTILSHAVAATAMGHVYGRPASGPRFWFWTALCSMLPDIDVLSFAFGIPYAALLGHRGLTHSFFFCAVLGWGAAHACGGGKGRATYFGLVTASHPLLDAMTNGGLGVALFAPFSRARYFLPWRPIAVSPIGPSFFSARGVDVLVSEIRWIWLPSAMIVLAVWIVRKTR